MNVIESEEVLRPTQAGDLTRSAEQLRSALDREGLVAADARQLLGEVNPEHQQALDFLLGRSAKAKRAPTRKVLATLEDALGLDLGSERLAGRLTQAARRLADVIGAVAGLACGWIVVGGLIEGDSLLLGDSLGAGGLAAFLLVLAILALFEALHTSATMLKIADLGALADQYPRAAALHRHFRTDHGLSRFLAGRQMVVVCTVFLCSPLSSFPDLTHWPLTSYPLPAVLRPFVTIGMPGALFVLWLGQLAPQFLATRRAVGLTNARVVTLAFKVAYGLEAIGLARPGFWLMGWDRTTANIPSSPALRWRQAAEEVDGFGMVGLTRDWVVSSNTELHGASAIRVYRDGTGSITDGSLLVPDAPVRLVLDAAAEREDGQDRPLLPYAHREEALPTGDRRFHKPLVPAVGSYRCGDRIRVSLDADYSSDPGRDLVHVDRPVRFVCFRVVPETPPASMPAAVLRSFVVGDGLGDLVELHAPVRIEPLEGLRGLPVIEHVIHFPPPNTLYLLDWEITLDV